MGTSHVIKKKHKWLCVTFYLFAVWETNALYGISCITISSYTGMKNHVLNSFIIAQMLDRENEKFHRALPFC